jgi:membrane fusion protein (multidrug efflux system)
VPQRAVTELQGSYQVAVADAQNKAHIMTVQVGDQIGNDWLINKGLEAGDQVIVEGTQKAREGTAVAPQPYAPEAKAP